MLQIISKKFFQSESIENLYVTPRKVVIYSNISLNNDIKSSIISLETINKYLGITTYLLKYDNVIEKQRNSNFQFVAIGDNDIVDCFLCCLSFWFNGIFSTDKFYIQSFIREESQDVCDTYQPKKIVPSVFERGIVKEKNQVQTFNNFMDKLIGLPRDNYLKVIKVIKQYRDALITINSNLELAYTMFVASIESLAQSFDQYDTKWDDCPVELTKELEAAFTDMEPCIVQKIKDAIINNTHAQLFRRYQAFALQNICESYFREEAVGVSYPCRQSQLSNAIKNSYKLRSKYVHVLKGIPDMLKMSGEGEIFTDGNECYFTFYGLMRFTKHVTWEFIKKQKYIEKEKVNYFSQLPNSIEVRLAPQYWISKEKGYLVKTANKYFEGFLSYFINFILSGENALLDLMPICKKLRL